LADTSGGHFLAVLGAQISPAQPLVH
jgi:hypothetical protein